MSTVPPSPGQPQPQPPLSAQIVPERFPAQPPPPPRRSFWPRFFLMLVLLLLFGSIVMNFILAGLAGTLLIGSQGDQKVQEKYVSHSETAKNKVAIITISGVITESDSGFVKRQIDRVEEDESVKAVVLRVSSPGGTVTGSDYIYHHLCKMVDKRKIPVVVSMGEIAASGGYYVSMAAGHSGVIFAEPTTFTGSIGVVIPHYDFSGFLNEHGVEEDSIASNPLKTMGSFARPMTDQEKKKFQALVDDNFARFKKIVRSGREEYDKNPAKLDELATGEVYTAQQALKNGLIDKIGFIEDAVEHAIKLADLDKNDVKVVRYKPEPSLRGLLLGNEASKRQTVDLQALLEMTTPRAYYLCTWLPGLGSAKE
jgi:protease IV